ncbi:hypothetical protein Dimus_016211, partial [Dionaea muscipula]
RRVQDLIDRDTAKNKWTLAEANLRDEKGRNKKLRSKINRLEEENAKVRSENDSLYMDKFGLDEEIARLNWSLTFTDEDMNRQKVGYEAEIAKLQTMNAEVNEKL